jgi:hypothetical protein
MFTNITMFTNSLDDGLGNPNPSSSETPKEIEINGDYTYCDLQSHMNIFNINRM